MSTEVKATSLSCGVRLVEIRLAALTRVEYTEVMQVPTDITPEELEQLVNERYDQVDGGLFVSDPDFWDRGHCYGTDADPQTSMDCTLVAVRDDDGDFDISPFAPEPNDQSA